MFVENGSGGDGVGELRELARLFLKLGFVAFGGPAAHVAMMRSEVVERRCWMDDQEFLDLNGATNLIPGPNSTELAIHIGRERAGWRGLLVAGACFIVPATLIVLAFAVLYERYGSTPAGESLLSGITPVVIAIVAQALWGLSKTAIKGPLTAVVGAGALILYLFLNVPEIPLLFGSALLVFLVENARRRWGGVASVAPFGFLALQPPAVGSTIAIFLSFLKIGSVLFGSGYVLLAFLRSEFVGPGVLTEQQLLDAVAVGQVTPGPVFTTATFIGYLLDGVPGALVATVGIFLPAFVFVAVTGPFISRLRRSPSGPVRLARRGERGIPGAHGRGYVVARPGDGRRPIRGSNLCRSASVALPVQDELGLARGKRWRDGPRCPSPFRRVKIGMS